VNPKIYLFLFVLSCAFFTICSFAQTTVVYEESTGIIANPERGFYKYSITDNNYYTASNYSNIDQDELTNWRTGTDKITVIYRTFLLTPFFTSPISAIYLNNVQQDFNAIRSAGLKCIVRFVYSQEINASQQQPAKAQILQHIQQVGSLLTNNKDVISCYQAGFIGTWGEWYYTNSTEFGTEGNINATQLNNRKEVIDSMLASTPGDMYVLLRTPLYKKNMYGATMLNNLTAYQNTALARIGFYNDSFLNSWGDYGTYSVNSEFENPVGTFDYTYLSNETQFTPMTGESSGMNAPRTDGSNAIVELGLSNWSTLNRDYYPGVITGWINSGSYPEIIKRLGYRISLVNSTFQYSGNTLSASISLKNTGFARAFAARNTYLLLKNNTTNFYYQFLLNTDFRRWVDTFSITQNIDVSSLPDGNYTSYLKLPDASPSLSDRPEYSVRFANNNVWVSGDGINDLGQSFVVAAASTYTFIGSGNWSDDANWENNRKPPVILTAGKEIIINPASTNACILNTNQTIAMGARITIAPGKQLLIPGNLSIQ